MPVISPAGVKAQGNVKLQWVATIADINNPTVAEITAGTALDISCFMAAEGWAPSIDAAKGTSTRRLCSKQLYEQFGNTTYSLADLSYVYNPQGAAASDAMKAYEKLVPGTSGYFVVRLGLDAVTVDWAATQFVSVWPVTLGERLEVMDPSDEFSEILVSQSVIVTSPRAERVAIDA